MNDPESWKGTLSKLELLGVSAEQRQQLFSSLAAVLAVGNLTFSAWEEGGEEQIVDKPDDAAALLQVLPKSLGDALTVPSSGLTRRPPSETAAPRGHSCHSQGPGRFPSS